MEESKPRQPVSMPEVREILSHVDPEEMDQIQRWTFDYVSKFSTSEYKEAREMKRRLVKECELTEDEAVEIINIRPTTLAELRSFTYGWKKLILAETLERIIKIIKEHS
ncbi:MAG: RNA polymerase Rpb4 [Nitrosopumilus sp.]|nr:RNA polymerase Rpb4 [Nitrosopumilus sp.]CAI9831825.1 RNA polymerase Rpb4 [Nitrosopumilaceae archaeon]MDA7941671.1 RNA polymerase Rpb4 [Nitrosopumilus sp.]MDA7943754.1 RNA polymerase Rpb4 [Nitrosopumilus sp.]MDA7945118.1 RNA polymerase Rpb4 [Nitrosopumilus sp.]